MSTAAETVEGPVDLPRGALPALVVLAVAAVAVMSGALVAYGVYGERITEGLDEACAAAYFEAGREYEETGNYDKAVQQFQLALDGQFASEAMRYRCGRSLGELLTRQRRYAEAVTAYERLPEAAFTEPGSLTGYATSLWYAGRNDEAKRMAERWLALAESAEDNQQTSWALDLSIRIAQEAGNTNAIIEYGERAVAIDPVCSARIPLANALHDAGRTEDALRHLEDFIAKSENEKLLVDAKQARARIGAS